MNPITLKDQWLEFTLLRVIGQGRQAICYEAEDQKKSIFFVKKLKDPTDENKRVFKKAYEINQSLMNHHAGNSIATVFGYFEDENNGPFVVMPKLTGNTLGKTHFKGLHELFAAFLRLSKAINQVHTAQFLTLDLSLENVYVLTDDGGMTGVYLHDFDNMLPMDMVGLADNIGTSFAFAAPEVLLEEFSSICRQTDYYSLAAMLHTLLFGYSPEADQSDPFRFHKTVKPYSDLLKNSVQIQKALNDFFRHCLALYPEDRYQSYAELEAALVRLCDLTHSNVVRPILSNYHPYIPEHYVRQEKELERLKKHFTQRKNDFAMAIIQSEVSGGGKTTLAHAFAYEVQREYDTVQFCRWDSDKGFEGVLEQIKVVDGYDPGSAIALDTQKNLIIVDNYDQESSEKLPCLGKSHVLFTSRFAAKSFNAYIHDGTCISVTLDCGKQLGTSIFKKVYHAISDEDLTDEQWVVAGGFLERVEHHPYACNMIGHVLADDFSAARSLEHIFANEVSSLKDVIPGESIAESSVQAHIDALFRSQIEQITDDIGLEILFLLSIDQLWSKKLLCTLIGDNPDIIGRVKAKNKIKYLVSRNLIKEEGERYFVGYKGAAISVHSLIQRVIREKFDTDPNWNREEHVFRSLYNLYCEYQDAVRTKCLSCWPVQYQKEVLFRTRAKLDEMSESFKRCHEITFLDSKWNWMHTVSLLHAANDPYHWGYSIYDDGWYYAYLEGEKTIFFVHTGKCLCPLLELNSVYPSEEFYPDEEFLTAAIKEKFLNMHGNVSVRKAICYRDRETWELPAYICNNPVREIMRMEAHEVKSLRIPEGVWIIGKYGYSRNLECLELPATLKMMLPGAFSHSHIRELYIPTSTQCIPFLAFSNCENLERITIAGEKIQLEDGCFQRCTNLREVELFGNAVEVDEHAFWGCNNLKRIVAPIVWKENHVSLLASLPAYEPENEEERRMIEEYREEMQNPINVAMRWTGGDDKQSGTAIDAEEVQQVIREILADLGVDKID